MLFQELSNKWAKTNITGQGYCFQYEKTLYSALNYLNYFSQYDVLNIKQEDIKCFLMNISLCNPKTGHKSSKKLLTDIVNVGGRIMEFGIDNDYCYKNPFRNKRNILPRKTITNTREPLSELQRNLVISVEHRAKTIAMIMMFCGLRLGEVLALEWDDIDLRNNRISVIKSAEQVANNRYAVTPHTKNGKDRYVPIPDNLQKYLLKARENAKFVLVCPKVDGTLQTPSSYKNLWNSYQNEINYYAYCQKIETKFPDNKHKPSKFNPNGIPKVIEKFTAHQLRHTYCTMLYLAEVDVLTSSKLMGHSSIDITLKIYTHLEEKYKQYNIDKFNEYINKSFS